MAKLVSSLLIIALLISLLMFLAHRRWGQKLQRPREQALTPLIRTRPGVSTEVGVSKLLDVMVKMKLFNDNSDDEDGEADGLTMEYRNLSNYPLHSCSVAQDPHNASKSRYLTILPYDNSRVVLKDGSSGDGFINASYIDGYRKPNYYIATQGPLAETVGDFWSMVWQEHCNLIVMLTKLNEQGKPKCDRYLPKRGRETFGQFTVTRVSATSPATQEFTSSTLRLQQVGAVDGSSREVQHLHYLQWPDHGVPSNTISIYRLLKHIHQSSHNTRHMLVHCSAGVGRTGTFIAIDYLLKMAEAEEKVDVFRCVDHMRGQRAGMVQTQEQYRFIYQVLLDVQEFGDTAIAVEHFPDCVRSLLTGEQGLPSLGCKREFESLQQFCRLYDSQTSTEAQRPCNLPKNRSPHILPGDRVRPSLVSVRNGDGSAGYINAIYTERHGVRDGFILTQLPLPHTLPDFWALVYDHDCMTVVSMNHPHQLDQSYVSLCGAEGCGQYGPFEVKERSVSVSSNITERLLIVRRHGQSCEREVRVLQLDNWPMDEPVPASPRTILSLDQRVQTWQQQHKYKPIVITCWDGAARSGLYCAASNLCQQIRRQRMVDVFQTVRTVRRSRPQALASLDQYGFCYRLAKDYLEQATASKEVAGAAEAGTADRDGDAPQ